VKLAKIAVSVPAHGTAGTCAVPDGGIGRYRFPVVPLPPGGAAFVIFYPVFALSYAEA
jgi:hypothetical protein